MGIVMKLIKGRPENEEGRLDKEIRVYDLLDSLGMEYYRTDHEPATTMEVCNCIDSILVFLHYLSLKSDIYTSFITKSIS